MWEQTRLRYIARAARASSAAPRQSPKTVARESRVRCEHKNKLNIFNIKWSYYSYQSAVCLCVSVVLVYFECCAVSCVSSVVLLTPMVIGFARGKVLFYC